MTNFLTTDEWQALSPESRQKVQQALVTAFVHGATWPVAVPWGRGGVVIATGEAMRRLKAGTLGVEEV